MSNCISEEFASLKAELDNARRKADEEDLAIERFYHYIMEWISDISIADGNYLSLFSRKKFGHKLDPSGGKGSLDYPHPRIREEKIIASIEKNMKELAIKCWPTGTSVNTENMEKLIDFINGFLAYDSLRVQNRKNIRSIYQQLIDAYTENPLIGPDSIYEDSFKKICNTHIILPIEGKVTGIYFFEKYYPHFFVSIEYTPQIMEESDNIEEITERDLDMALKTLRKSLERKDKCLNLYIDSSEKKHIETALKTGDLEFISEFLTDENQYELLRWLTGGEEDERKKKKRIRRRRGEAGRASSYTSKFKKWCGINLQTHKWIKKDIYRLEDLLEYIEYDFTLSGNINEKKRSSRTKKERMFL